MKYQREEYKFKEKLALKQQLPLIHSLPLFQPEGVEVSQFENELDISFKQNLDISSLAIFCLLAPLSYIFLSKGLEDQSNAVLLAIPSFSLALLFLMRWIATMINKIHIVIDDEYLSVVRRPVKFSFKKDEHYKVDEFNQFYVKETKKKGTEVDMYTIYAILDTPRGQRHVKLAPIIESKSKAKYIVLEIESHLGIS